MKRLRLALRVGAGLLVLAGVGLVWLGFAPTGDDRPHPFNHDRNAVWLEHRWLEREQPEAEMEALFARQIGRASCRERV